MPLIHSTTASAVSKNIATEMEHGKMHKQAVAIAMSVQRKARNSKDRRNKLRNTHNRRSA